MSGKTPDFIVVMIASILLLYLENEATSKSHDLKTDKRIKLRWKLWQREN